MKTSWRHLCKTSWRCLEDILKTSYGQDEYVRLDQDVWKTSSEDDERHLQDVFIKMDVCWDVMNIYSYSFIKTFKDDSIRRTFFQGKQNPLHFLRSYIMLYKISSSIKYLQDLKAHLHQIRNGQQSSSLVYSKFQWKCEQCSNRTIFEQVCHIWKCWVGFFSGIYLTRQLLGMLVVLPWIY